MNGVTAFNVNTCHIWLQGKSQYCWVILQAPWNLSGSQIDKEALDMQVMEKKKQEEAAEKDEQAYRELEYS